MREGADREHQVAGRQEVELQVLEAPWSSIARYGSLSGPAASSASTSSGVIPGKRLQHDPRRARRIDALGAGIDGDVGADLLVEDLRHAEHVQRLALGRERAVGGARGAPGVEVVRILGAERLGLAVLVAVVGDPGRDRLASPASRPSAPRRPRAARAARR